MSSNNEITDFVEVGIFGGEKVEYSPTTDIIKCKDRNIFYDTFVRFLNSDRFRGDLDNETVMFKKNNTYKIGCLEDTKVNFNELHAKINKIRNVNNKI